VDFRLRLQLIHRRNQVGSPLNRLIVDLENHVSRSQSTTGGRSRRIHMSDLRALLTVIPLLQVNAQPATLTVGVSWRELDGIFPTITHDHHRDTAPRQ